MATSYLPCYEFLQSYAEFLSANSEYRPHPILFSAPFCQGSYWPPFDYQPSAAGIISVDDLFKQAIFGLNNQIVGYNYYFGSIYIPPGFQVSLTGLSTNETFLFPNNPIHPYTLIPILTNAENYFYPGDNQPIMNRVKGARITGPMKFLNQGQGQWIPTSENEWKYNRCMGKETTIVGLSTVHSYDAGSDECESFMTSFCEAQPDDPACSCLVDEKTIRDQFCQGSTEGECANASEFAAFISVPCFGANCAQSGYRFQRFRQANCNATYCQQIIQLTGNNVFADGSSTLWCGNQPLADAVNSSSSGGSDLVAPVSSTPNVISTLTWWQWMLIGFGVLLVCVVVPLFLVLWRTGKNAKSNPSQPLRSMLQDDGDPYAHVPDSSAWPDAPSTDFLEPADDAFVA